MAQAAEAAASANPVLAVGFSFAAPAFVKSLLGTRTRVRQRFFPQCTACSSLQSDALRRNLKKLVLHFGGVQPYAYAGVLVGLRQYAPPPPGRGAQRATSLDAWFADATAAGGAKR